MNITKGKNPKAKKILLYGPEGIGKTTLASQFPRPLFLDTERGTSEYALERIDIHTWPDLEKAFGFLTRSEHGYRTVILDTIDSALPMLTEKICSEHGMSALADFGFGKGYALLSDRLSSLLDQCNQLVDRGIHVLFLAHSQVKHIEQPDLPEGYDKYELRLPERVAGLFKTRADAVFFGNFRVTLVEEKGRHRALGGRERVLYATHSPTHDAKNRCGIPERVPFHIDSLAPLFAGLEPPETHGAPQHTAPPGGGASGVSPSKASDAQAPRAPDAGHPMDAIVGELEPRRLQEFLLRRGLVTPEQGYRDLPAAYVQRVLQMPDLFRKSVNA
jgi:hypothetical protein